MLPLMPQDNGGVPTVFWVDNFDGIIENVTGGGSINTTHIMVFQEMTENASLNQSDRNIARRKARMFTTNHVMESTSGIKIDSRATPPNVSTTGKDFQDSSRIADKYLAVITKDIKNQCLHNRKQPNYTKFSRYAHSIVTCGPLSDIFLLLTLIPCLLSWIQLFFLCS